MSADIHLRHEHASMGIRALKHLTLRGLDRDSRRERARKTLHKQLQLRAREKGKKKQKFDGCVRWCFHGTYQRTQEEHQAHENVHPEAI